MDDPLRNLSYPARRLRGEDGMTLIEVLVSILLVGLIGMSFLGLDAAGRTSADQRRVEQATQLAQADQERLRGMSADQLATLNQTRTITVDNNTYTVLSQGKYQSAATSGDSCASSAAAADYAKVTSTVSFFGHDTSAASPRPPVVEQSIITPRIGGSLVVQAQDQGAAGLPGATVVATGTDADTSGTRRTGTTDAGGCVIFGSLPVGTYSVATSLAGYIDSTGSTAPTNQVTTTSGNTTNLTVRLGQPGSITATFRGVAGATTASGQQAPSISWTNTGMPTPGWDATTVSSPATSIATDAPVFPFIVGTPTTFTGNYTVYAGKCAAALPPTANQKTATVSPGAAASVVVDEPMINVTVTAGGPATKPAHIKLTNSCGESWQSPVSSAATIPATGWLAFPGQPYGTGYTVCADAFFTGFGSFKGTVTVSNTSFTATNLAVIAITTSGTC
jgi:type II secretory pathway pseudopilin PulG